MNIPLHQLASKESVGNFGVFGLEIKVGASLLPNLEALNSEAIRIAAYQASDLIEDAVMTAVVAANHEAQERAKKEKENLLASFDGIVYVEEIPNGYCPKWCCKHLPWFIVTTRAGRIKIGWRKSVINIDWSETKGTKTSTELFAAEPVTKDTKGIHAYGYPKAKEYIAAIVNSAPQ